MTSSSVTGRGVVCGVASYVRGVMCGVTSHLERPVQIHCTTDTERFDNWIGNKILVTAVGRLKLEWNMFLLRLRDPRPPDGVRLQAPGAPRWEVLWPQGPPRPGLQPDAEQQTDSNRALSARVLMAAPAATSPSSTDQNTETSPRHRDASPMAAHAHWRVRSRVRSAAPAR